MNAPLTVSGRLRLHATTISPLPLYALHLPAPQHAELDRARWAHHRLEPGDWVWVQARGEHWVPGILAQRDFIDWLVLVLPSPLRERCDSLDARLCALTATPHMLAPLPCAPQATWTPAQRAAVQALSGELAVLAQEQQVLEVMRALKASQ